MNTGRINVAEFLEWAKANCIPVKAIEGRYKTFRPEIPQTSDYEGSQIVAEGNLCVTYSTIMHRFKVEVYVPGFEIQFEVFGHIRDLMPRPVFRSYHQDFTGNRNIESWQKSGYGVRQYLRVSVDKPRDASHLGAIRGVLHRQGRGRIDKYHTCDIMASLTRQIPGHFRRTQCPHTSSPTTTSTRS